ncbi:tetratricopeptide repeat protein [Hyalangium versicolor]|uniref:tetratricopeptide repeat protein n=1 Tax=Hyalangium versicolor TaxID=2861190 RepID=UPI001CCA0020|nr:tetratricopeptide repeat protein [Hyalangium versicolor]
MKIHHFKKRPPRSKDEPRRDGGRVTLEIERPTVPEFSLYESSDEEHDEEPVRAKSPPKPEPAAKAKGRAGSAAPEADGRASRKPRGASASRKAPSSDEPPQGSVAERLNTSRKLVSEGRFDDARAILERLVTMGVASGPVHSELGAIYMAQGAMDRALARFDDALNMEPMDLFARVCRGEARLGRGDLRLAREDLQRVLDLGTAGSPLVERAQQLLQRADEQVARKRQ